MKIALLGYGRMGKTIEKIAKDRGHTIGLTVDQNDKIDLEGIDAAIDFSVPNAAVQNISACLNAGVPVVSGTTGWLNSYEEMVALCERNQGAFLYASNFSVGVNIFFELNRQLASMMQTIEGYAPSIDETHHIHKLDAPSGTAITLAEGLLPYSKKNKWILDDQEDDAVTIRSFREGEVPGTHKVSYTGDIDTITIAHQAHSRQGFAQGAVIAAEWLVDKKGVFNMQDVLGLGKK